ncbi:hypothetical protein [Lacibacter sp.]|uniref:hypothetical protein n=1 Tax=Lacibacter sp. TaxID=1915409 RepID=UPI002B4B2731|nr:hypothetical protein [Lacibacter sp.]HLP35879.1 hypothetical protein [Lacibacter sp.]
MNKILQVENQILTFEFIEAAKVWRTNSIIDGKQIEIEIDYTFHKQPEIDWQHFAHFFKFISVKSRLQELAILGIPLVSEVGKAFFIKAFEETKDWKMVFKNSIFYNGRVDEYNQKDKYSFSILYDYVFEKDGRTDGDAYGLYIVDMEDLQIVGARRNQC